MEQVIKQALAVKLADTGVSPAAFSALLSARTLTVGMDKSAIAFKDIWGILSSIGGATTTAGKWAILAALGVPWAVGLPLGAASGRAATATSPKDIQSYKDRTVNSEYESAIKKMMTEEEETDESV
jgi:hypothetical protein